MFKRLIVVLVLLALLVTACAKPTPTAPVTPFRIAVVMPSAITDMAFSQSMWNALVAIQTEMGGEAVVETQVLREYVQSSGCSRSHP